MSLPLDLGDLTLRRLRHTDFAEVLAYYSNVEVARYCEWEAMSADQVAALMEGQGSVLPGDPGVPLIIAAELKSESRVIGDCSLTITRPDVREGEIGYVFHPAWHGHGYASRAVRAVLKYAFVSLELHRIIAQVDVRNERSWRLLERIGMRREGHFRQCSFVKGEWIDDYLYGVMENQWSMPTSRSR